MNKTKYRIKERKYDNGNSDYTLQKRVFGLFYITLVRCKGLYDEVQCLPTLDAALERLAEYEKEPVSVVSTNYIYKQWPL